MESVFNRLFLRWYGVYVGRVESVLGVYMVVYTCITGVHRCICTGI